jgi:membrane protease YdiL (CAAX protease family)
MEQTNARDRGGRATGAFLALTFVFSWSLWLASGMLGRDAGPLDGRWLVAQIGVFGPSLAALIVSAFFRRELLHNSARIASLFLPVIALGLLIAAAAPPSNLKAGPLLSVLAIVAAVGVALLFSPLNRMLRTPGTGETPGVAGAGTLLLSIVLLPGVFLVAWGLSGLQGAHWTLATGHGGAAGLSRIVAVSFAMNLLFGGSLGEEIGWRGFLLPRLLRRHTPITASLILGVVWALWHAPIDLTSGLFGQGPVAIFARLVTTLPLAILFTWLYLKGNGSLLVPILLHTSINILSDLGFSHIERAMVTYFGLLALFAVIVCASPTMRASRGD